MFKPNPEMGMDIYNRKFGLNNVGAGDFELWFRLKVPNRYWRTGGFCLRKAA
jgi:hypothetical protein